MNTVPAFNGPGINYSQPIFPSNNAIQGVPMFNSQIFHPTQTFSQPTSSDNNMHVSQPQYGIIHASPAQHTSNNNQYLHRMSSTSDEEFLGFEENETGENPWQVVKTKNTKRRKINTNNPHVTNSAP